MLLILGFEGDQAYFGLFCLILSLQIVTKSPRWQIRCTSSLPEPTALIYNILEERFHTLSLREATLRCGFFYSNCLKIRGFKRKAHQFKSFVTNPKGHQFGHHTLFLNLVTEFPRKTFIEWVLGIACSPAAPGNNIDHLKN